MQTITFTKLGFNTMNTDQQIYIIGNAIQKTWESAQKKNTRKAWDRVYSTLRGMWLLGLWGEDYTIEAYTNMLMGIAQDNRTAAQLARYSKE